jgi:hypothetical protein
VYSFQEHYRVVEAISQALQPLAKPPSVEVGLRNPFESLRCSSSSLSVDLLRWTPLMTHSTARRGVSVLRCTGRCTFAR